MLVVALLLAGAAVLYLGFKPLKATFFDPATRFGAAISAPTPAARPSKKAPSGRSDRKKGRTAAASPFLSPSSRDAGVALGALASLLFAGTTLLHGTVKWRREMGAQRRELREEQEALEAERRQMERRDADRDAELAEVVATRDSEAQKRRQEFARRNVLQQAVESADDVVIITEADPSMPTRVVYVNPSFERMTGYRPDEIIGQTPKMLQGDGSDPKTLAYIHDKLRAGQPVQAEVINYRKDGTPFWVELNITPCVDENGWQSHWISIQRDITERKRSEEKIAWQATHDALTDLPNRNLYETRLDEAVRAAQQQLERWQREQERREQEKKKPQKEEADDLLKPLVTLEVPEPESVGVLFLDLDRFKNVNDSLGHISGDRLLQLVARRLEACIAEQDLIARLGGDEFAVLLTGVPSEETATEAAQRLLESLEEPFQIDGRELFVTASIGICLAPQSGTDITTLLKNADVAMYSAKELGRNTYRVYNESMNARALERLAMETHLRRAALEQHSEFHLVYQPQVDLRTGTVFGVEALIRWESPDLGKVSPGQFIPLAEETGLVVAIDEWVMGEACRQAALWQERGTPLRVSVNLSARHFSQKNLVTRVAQILEETCLGPEWLDIEVTERSLLKGPEVGEILRGLKALGVRLSVDDFGTGQSALSYLRAFPVDVLKIDRSFVAALSGDSSRSSEAIISGIIGIAHGMGLEVIAEGIETEEQHACLRSLNCDAMQGFLFSPPTTPLEVIALRDAAEAEALDRGAKALRLTEAA